MINCGVYFKRALRINYEKCDEKFDQWYLSILLNICNY